MVGTFVVDQKTLLSILASMLPICSKRTTIDATSSILFQVSNKELVLKSTDLEISLQSNCFISGSSFSRTESFLVPGRRIFELVKELDGSIECSLESSQLLLKAGAVRLGLNIKDIESFPPFPERIENLLRFDTAFLLELLDKVAFLIPPNNANPSLNGLFLEFSPDGLLMTATDGHCLAHVTTKKYTLGESKQWLLPRRAVFEIKKVLEHMSSQEIFLGTCGNQLVFSGESFNFFTKLLTDQFPPYRTILEKDGFVPASLDRECFVKTLRRSSCLLSGQFLATQFSFEKERLNVVMENKEVGTLKEELALTFKGARLDMRFYAPYLLNGLQSFEDKDITFYLKNTAKPIMFESDTPNYQVTYLVMPVSATTQSS